jgi:hypothetical protein
MYAFPRIELPIGALEAAEAAGHPADSFYALSLLEQTGLCTGKNVCVYVSVCVFLCVCVCVYIYIYMYIYIYIYLYMYMYAYVYVPHGALSTLK